MKRLKPPSLQQLGIRKPAHLIGPLFALISGAILMYAVFWQVGERRVERAALPNTTTNIRMVSLVDEEPMTGTPLSADVTYKLVNLFASWCTPCIAELPHLDELSKQTGLPLVGIAWNDHEAKLRPWLSEHGNPFEVIYLDAKGALLGNISISGLPETMLVDNWNRVLLRHRGPVTPENMQVLSDKLMALVDETAQ